MFNYSFTFYFRSCSGGNTYNGHSDNESIHTGSVLKFTNNAVENGHSGHAITNGDEVVNDEATSVVPVDDDIEFHEGWNPTHYE